MAAPKNKSQKLMDVDTLWQIERVGSPALSPDGAQVVASVTKYDMALNKGRTSLWLFSTLGGRERQLTACGDKDGQALWSPDGSRIAFVAKREQEGKKDEAAQLYVIAPDGGEAQRVSDVATGVDAFKWMPDGKRIVFVSWVWPQLKGGKAQAARLQARKARKDTAYVTEEAQYRFWDHNIEQDRVPHLHVLDVRSGKVRDLFEGTPYEINRREPDGKCFDVSPDGKRIVFAYDPLPQKRSDHVDALVELEFATGKFQTIASDAAWSYGNPVYDASGERIALLANHYGKKHTMPDWLAVWTRGSGKAKPKLEVASADWDCSVGAGIRWCPSGAAVWLLAEERAQQHVWRFDLATRKASAVARGGYMQGFDVGHDGAGEVLVSLGDSMTHPSQMRVHRADAAQVWAGQRVERFNDALLKDVAMGRFESVTYAGGKPKGQTAGEVQMWLIYPPNFDPKKKYPMLHAIHGGPHACSADTFHYRWNNQVFAAQGYVVACVNYHGSSSFGNGFLDSITGRWGQLELQDIEAATDLMLKKPYIDPKRVFATGGSYGGYMVAWMNGHVKPGRYQAYVCHAGCYDWISMFSDDAWMWHAKELGGWYWDDPQRVARQSPHSFAQHMHTPTLVIHGALDYRVPDAQGLAYYNVLKARDVPARLVWFPDENHWVLKPANAKLWYTEFFAWLKRFDLQAASKSRS
jgi:dipeptidyl aminopeptidase/acylaminoacyl peptidase